MNDKILVKSYMIDDKRYIVVNEVDYNNNHYLYLSNEDDIEDIIIRKVKDGYLDILDNKEEVLEILKLIAN